jgi:glucose-6-phosphate-specific signal transduction histidine kinase
LFVDQIVMRTRKQRMSLFLSMLEKDIAVIAANGSGFDSGAPHVGLGLVSVRERVQTLHGTVNISCQPNKGPIVQVNFLTRARVSKVAKPQCWPASVCRIREAQT